MPWSISIIAAILVGLALWLIFSVKKPKKRPRYTQDEERKHFWDADGMLENLKDKPPVQGPPEPEKIQRKKKKTATKRGKSQKPKIETDTFDLEKAIVASEIMKKKDRTKRH